MSRVKKPAVQAPPWDAVEQLICSLGREQISQAELMAGMDREIARVRERYAERLGNVEAAIKSRMALLEAAAQANPDKFTGGKKSVEFLTGTIGYRTGMPTLKTLAKWTWKKVLKHLIEGKRDDYCDFSVTVKKSAILNDRDTLGEKGLSALGLKVHQSETFFVEPKLSKKDAAAA